MSKQDDLLQLKKHLEHLQDLLKKSEASDQETIKIKENQKPKLDKSLLAKAMEILNKAEIPPSKHGQMHPTKPYKATKHSTGGLSWYYEPGRAKQYDDEIAAKKDAYVATHPPEHQKVVSDFLDSVQKLHTRHAVMGVDKIGGRDMPRARHIRGLLNGDPNYSIKIHDPGSLSMHVNERHGERGGAKSSIFNFGPKGLEKAADECIGGSDNALLQKSPTGIAALANSGVQSARSPNSVNMARSGSKSPDSVPDNPGPKPVLPKGPGGQSGGGSRPPRPLSNRLRPAGRFRVAANFRGTSTTQANSSLTKGAAKKLYPEFDPKKENDKADLIAEWTDKENSMAREMLPRMEGGVRLRGLNKLRNNTQFRKNPETGETEYLMHRGMSKDEHDSHKMDGPDSKTSWTPNFHTARTFADAYGEDEDGISRSKNSRIVSAWIPEQHIHTMPYMYGHHKDIKKYRDEHEVVVDPHKTNIHKVATIDERALPTSTLKQALKVNGPEGVRSHIKENLAPEPIKKSQGREVSVIAVLGSKGILLGKRSDNGRWTNPGGHLNPGEDPHAGAVRELYEETGIKVDPDQVHYIGTDHVTTHTGKQMIIHCFLVNGDFPTSSRNDPDQEVKQWVYVDVSKGVPEEILANLHSPKNCLLKKLGLQK